ncbi:MAG: hypothetical protein A3H35_08300 [Betaproteobacteria bacterium RIFCSPLOWO2_02_FULL_62_17]|nr:MAG: hypothetical protein A3H35_08300 [Betaproteobacteria bacterium RIFCSPLOWO2_02_FULL_62_17]
MSELVPSYRTVSRAPSVFPDRRLAARCMLLASLFLAASSLPRPAGAQSFPQKPIRIISQYPAGAIVDTLTRQLGQEMADLLKSSPVRYQFCVHAGAIHGYALPDRDIYDKQAAERDWEHIFAMFHRQIPAYAA